MNGIDNIVMKLLNTVRVTDRAVSPFARWAIRLEVGPSGHAARIIIPIAISGLRGKREVIANPKNRQDDQLVGETNQYCFRVDNDPFKIVNDQ